MNIKRSIKRKLIKQAFKKGAMGRLIRREAARRVLRPLPLIGAGAVIALAAGTIRRKGVVKGSADVVLDLIPVVGITKTVVEVFTGDLIPDNKRIK